MTLATEQGFPQWVAWGTILRGWALAEQGQERRGLPRCVRAGRLASHGGRDVTAVFLPCWPRRMGKRAQTDGGAARAGRGAGRGTQHWGAFLRGGAASAQGELLLQQAVPDAQLGGSLLSAGPRPWPAASRPSRWNCGPP